MKSLLSFLAVFILQMYLFESAPAQVKYAFNTLNLHLVGDAQQIDDWVRINPIGEDRCGAFWYDEQLAVHNGFETGFVFSISDLGGSGADGFAFVIQNHAQEAIGLAWNNIGYGTIPNSIAIEFDTWFNGYYNEPDGHHISVQTRGTEPNSPHHDHSLGSVSCPELEVLIEHVVHIRYEFGNLVIYFDDLANPMLSVPMDVSEILELNEGMAWLGFTGSTGTRWENHDIYDWWIDGMPVSNIELTWGLVKALYK